MAKIDFSTVRAVLEGATPDTGANQKSVKFCNAFLDILEAQEFDEGVGPPMIVGVKGSREVRFVWYHAKHPEHFLWLTFQDNDEIQQFWSWPKGDACGGWVRTYTLRDGTSHVMPGDRDMYGLLVKNVNTYGQRNPTKPLKSNL